MIELSENYSALLHGSPFHTAKIQMARRILELDVAGELMQQGLICSSEATKSIIDGFPPEVLAKLLAERS